MVGTRSWENGFFVQDDFRATSRLTLNLGLRYDVLSWPVEVEDRGANFDLNSGALVVLGSNGTERAGLPNDYHDFAPRLGFAYQLTGDGKTVVRGGFGIFYFLDRGGISNQLEQNPPFSGANSVSYASGARITLSGSLACEPNCTQAQLIATNATGPLPNGNFTNLNLAAPTNVSVIAFLPSNLTPRVSEYDLQIQRQVGKNQAVSVAYVGDIGSHLMRNYNANQPAFDVAPGAAGSQMFPNLNGTVTVQDTSGHSYYNSLQAQYERRLTAGWEFLTNFVWSKLIDDTCGDLDTCTPQTPTNFKLERGLSNQDIPYRLVISSIYDLPFGRGRHWGSHWNRAIDEVLGGWQVNGIYQLQAGLPFSVTVDGNPGNVRANCTGSPSVDPGNLAHYMSTAGFGLPAATVLGGNIVYVAPGTCGRDTLRGPGYSNLDFSVFKNFEITERIKLEVRAQSYNLTNTPHFGQPNGDLGGVCLGTTATGCTGTGTTIIPNLNANFGQITSTIPFTQRQEEVALRVVF